jgi:hypothetical protein
LLVAKADFCTVNRQAVDRSGGRAHFGLVERRNPFRTDNLDSEKKSAMA